jgi:hypothetical protein
MDQLDFCGGIVQDWNLAGQKNSKLVVWDCVFRGVTLSVHERTLIFLRRDLQAVLYFLKYLQADKKSWGLVKV